jgi:hypothetical protein
MLIIAPLSTAFSLVILFEMIVFIASVPFVIISLIITR